MPPHCDSLDGPVVTAARHALEAEDVDLVLPFVPATGEAEVTETFRKALAARADGPVAREVADRWFFENVVRVHRAGEGAAYTGLKPAGLDVGPVIPLAERALESGDSEELAGFLAGVVTTEVGRRLAEATALRGSPNGDVVAARRYVEAMLGLQVWAHALYRAAHSEPHEGGHHG